MFCSVSEAATFAKILISGYPNSSTSDPESYASQLVAIFTEFDTELVRRAISPFGIPTDHPNFMPSIGAVTAWMTKKQEHFSMITRRIPPPVEQVGEWIENVPTPRLKQMGDDWLARRDPIAKELSGKAAARREYSEEEKREFLADAYRVGAEIPLMKLTGSK